MGIRGGSRTGGSHGGVPSGEVGRIVGGVAWSVSEAVGRPCFFAAALFSRRRLLSGGFCIDWPYLKRKENTNRCGRANANRRRPKIGLFRGRPCPNEPKQGIRGVMPEGRRSERCEHRAL